MTAHEINFDGIVGPTHSYSGLSLGNVASLKHSGQASSPKKAALEGLNKMKMLLDLGVRQAVLPPHDRPHIPTLKLLGYGGTDAQIVQKCFHENPTLFLQCASASAMWTANAATVSPSADCPDKKVHITPANLSAKFHRSIETQTTLRVFKKIFKDQNHFAVHEPLPAGSHFSDEGAANHNRFCRELDEAGVELFVFGKHDFRYGQPRPRHFSARQTFEASQAIARKHRLAPEKTVLAQQAPLAIDAGVFHNDVISTGHRHVFFCHEQAFLNADQVFTEIKQKWHGPQNSEICLLLVKSHHITVQEAVNTYLFNSQIVDHQNGMALIAPGECEENKVIRRYIETLVSSAKNPINDVFYVNIRQSMQNGGGPACLRLRVTLTEEEITAVHQGVILTHTVYDKLCAWVSRHYRDTLTVRDLADPQLLTEGWTALDELTQLLGLGSIYEFQKN